MYQLCFRSLVRAAGCLVCLLLLTLTGVLRPTSLNVAVITKSSSTHPFMADKTITLVPTSLISLYQSVGPLT